MQPCEFNIRFHRLKIQGLGALVCSILHSSAESVERLMFNVIAKKQTREWRHIVRRDLEWESHSFVSCCSRVFRRALCHEMKGPVGGGIIPWSQIDAPLPPPELLVRNLNWIPWLNPSDETVDMRTSLVLSAANMTNKRSNFIFLIPQSLKNFWMLNSEYRRYDFGLGVCKRL